MIAQQKPKPSAPEESASVGLPDNIFAGLQFPSVPTTKPVFVPKSTPSSQQTVSVNVVNQDTKQSVEMRTVKPASKPIDSRALSVLYQNEPGDSSHLYPSIPAFQPSTLPATPQVGTMLSPPTQHQSTEVEESQPLLSSQHSNAEVFLDVFTENQRLIEELNRLQRDMQNEDSVAPTVVRASSVNSNRTVAASPHIHVSSTTANVQHGQQQMQQPQQANNVGLKYVCCGSCRQWLSSPRDAAYVYCPNCQAINNCLPQPEGPERLPPRRLESSTPWYLQCFERIWS